MSANYEAIADKLAQRARDLGADEHALDELVCDRAMDADELNALDDEGAESRLDELEAGASEINNGGFASQILYLLECGVPQAEVELALGLLAA